MSTVRTIVHPGVAKANQLKLEVGSLQSEIDELRMQNQQFRAMLSMISPEELARISALLQTTQPPPAPIQRAAIAAAPRVLGGDHGVPPDVLAQMLGEANAPQAQIAAPMSVAPVAQPAMMAFLPPPVAPAAQRLAAQMMGQNFTNERGQGVTLMTAEEAKVRARTSQTNRGQPNAPQPGQTFGTPSGGTVKIMNRPARADASNLRAPQQNVVPFNGQAMPPSAFLAAAQARAAAAEQPQIAGTAPQGPQLSLPAGPVIDASAYEVAELGSAGRPQPAPVAPVVQPAKRTFAGAGAGQPLAFRE